MSTTIRMEMATPNLTKSSPVFQHRLTRGKYNYGQLKIQHNNMHLFISDLLGVGKRQIFFPAAAA